MNSVESIETAHVVAAVSGALGVVLLLAVPRRAAALAGLILLAAAEGALLGAFAVGDRVLAPAALGLGLFAAAVFGAGAAVLVRRPELVTPLALAAAPFRLPIDFGREHRFFVAVAEPGQLGRLLPLYLVLGAAALALAWRLLVRGEAPPVLPRELAWPLAAFLAFASLSLLWTDDARAGENLLAYFLLPFAVLVAVVAAAPFPAWMPRVLATIAVALGLVFAVVGLWQQATGRLLFYAPNLEVSNSYASYFRVTSLFRDPSLFGRHLVLAIAVLVVAVWMRRVHIVLAGALVAVLWLGLFFTYSQSSFVALIVVVLAIAALAGQRTMRLAVAAAALVALIAGAGIVAAAVQDESAQRATSDRSRRVEVTLDVFADRPVAGVGVGSQPRASQQRAERPGPVANYVSHTTPLTVAAELGALGFVLYALVLAAAVWLVEQVRRRDAALGLTLGAVLLALFVHSLFYSGFFEDPITWLALAIGASFLASRSVTGGAARVTA
jgi:O-antigen ligase